MAIVDLLVDAAAGWVSTGIVMQSGDTIHLTASGLASPNVSPPAGGPDGPGWCRCDIKPHAVSFGGKRSLVCPAPIEEFNNQNSSSSPGGAPIRSVGFHRGETMSVTRMAVFIGIMCAVWVTSPSTANAFEEFVGQSDKGTTKVKTCVAGKGGRESFANKTEFKVELIIDLFDGDGLDGDDSFDAFFRYGGPAAAPPFPALFGGVWSKTGERNGIETYQLTPGGDLTELSTPFRVWPDSDGWEDLLEFIRQEAGDACLSAPPNNVSPALSDLVKGTLVVYTNKPVTCDEGSCVKAKVKLKVKAFMKADESEIVVFAKTDRVKFKYKAKGYVVLNNP